MAIKVERDGNKTVLAQTRRGVRIAAWVLFALAVIGAVMSFREERAAQAIERTAVHCSRAAGVCGFTPSTGSGQVMHIDTLVAATVETDGSGDDARVTAAVTRRDGLPTYRPCEVRASDPEVAGIRRAVTELTAFLNDRNMADLAVECATRRRQASTGATAMRIIGPMVGMAVLLLAVLLFLVEVRTEVDPDAGLVRVKGRSAVPPRRWSIERPIAEVASVMVRQRTVGRERSFRVYLHFTDGTATLLLSPSTGWRTDAERWLGDLRRALGLPAAPS